MPPDEVNKVEWQIENYLNFVVENKCGGSMGNHFHTRPTIYRLMSSGVPGRIFIHEIVNFTINLRRRNLSIKYTSAGDTRKINIYIREERNSFQPSFFETPFSSNKLVAIV
jgi:hypothetical protein